MFDGWRRWRYIKPPLLPLFEHMLQNVSRKRKRAFYQSLAFIMTFVTYAIYHFNKRTFTIVKSVLSPNCYVTPVNNTCHPWQPFTHHKQDAGIFSWLDFTFMISYSVTLIASGLIAEHTNLRIFLSFGMVMTGVASAIGGLIKYLEIHRLSFFFLLQIFTAVTQSTGYPCVIEIVAMWFPKGRRGIAYGTWTLCICCGNVLGSIIIGFYASRDWGLSFTIPAIVIICFSVVVFLILIPEPDLVNINIKENIQLLSANEGGTYQFLLNQDDENSSDEVNMEDNENTDNENTCIDKHDELDNVHDAQRGISLWDALKIPGVIEYAMTSSFSKFILYTFFFWLPYFIQSVTIEGKIYDPSDAAYFSIIFDIGGAVCVILAGVVFDITNAPAIISISMLILSVPCMYLFMTQLTSLSMFLALMFITGGLINVPFALISTMAAANLGSHKTLQKKTKGIAVVTAIFDSSGSVGAAIAPLLVGLIASKSTWTNVLYMLMLAALFGAASLLRQLHKEIKTILSGNQTK